MRNTDWMRDLFGQMAHYGTHPMNLTREEVCIPEDIIPVCICTYIRLFGAPVNVFSHDQYNCRADESKASHMHMLPVECLIPEVFSIKGSAASAAGKYCCPRAPCVPAGPAS